MLPRVNRSSKRAFTLVELLVVIGIIAVLIGILMPSMNQARKAARRTVCLNGQRQVAQGILMYAIQFKGVYPPPIPNTNDTVIAYDKKSAYVDKDKVGTIDRWERSIGMVKEAEGAYQNIGQIFGVGIIPMNDAAGFYCPERQGTFFTYESSWENRTPSQSRFLGYCYRLLGTLTTTDPDIPENANNAVIKKWSPLRQGTFKGVMSMTADVFNGNRGEGGISDVAMPHIKPYGVTVGYSDGHAEFKEVGKLDYDLSVLMAQNPSVKSVAERNKYEYLMFRAWDTGDNYQVVRDACD